MNFYRLLPRRKRRRPHHRFDCFKVVPTFMCGGTGEPVHCAGTIASTRTVSISNSRVCGAGAPSPMRLTNAGSRCLECNVTVVSERVGVRPAGPAAKHVARRPDRYIVHAYSFYGNVFAITARRGSPAVPCGDCVDSRSRPPI